jgi:carbonic anhydrase/acetyltransferase-like protein (isoleucine patch superfamily)
MSNKTIEDKKSGSIRGFILISIILLIVFSLSFLPVVLFSRIVLFFIAFDKLWHLFLIPVFLYLGVAITVIYLLLISGFFIHVFNLKYESGVYDYNFKNRMAMKWIIVCILYTTGRKINEIFPTGFMKYMYFRLLGMKIGKNTLVGGTIMDPCLTEIGDNCTMGLFAVLYGHIHNYEKGTITLDRIKIGNNVVIGAGAFIMPGVIVEDNVKIATGSVVTKGQILKKGKTYGGIPAKEIKKERKK